MGSSVEPMARSALLSPAKGRAGVGCVAPPLPRGSMRWDPLLSSLPKGGVGQDPLLPPLSSGGPGWGSLLSPLPKGGVGQDPLLPPLSRGGPGGVRCFLPCQREEWGRLHCSLPYQREDRGGVRGVFSSDAGAPSGSGRAWCHPPAPAPRPPAHRGRCGSPPLRRCGPCRRCTRRWHPPRWWGWWRGSAP